MTRAAAAAWWATWIVAAPAVAQHEHHGAQQVDTLAVRAVRDAIQLRSGATVVDVRASGATGSILDLLRTIPGIAIDGDGRIRMRGVSSITVLVDGRRSTLTGDALASFLRQTPAATLQRVEAGTALSAGLDAGGSAGVINVVIRDRAVSRTALRSLAVSAATDEHLTGSLAATGEFGSRLGWDASYSMSSTRPRTDSRTGRQSEVPGDLPLHTDLASRAEEAHRLHAADAGAMFSAATTSLAVRGRYAWMEGTYRNRSQYAYTNAAGASGSSTTRSLLSHAIPTGELSLTAQGGGGRVRYSIDASSSIVHEESVGEYDDEAAGYRYLSASMDARHRVRGVRTHASTTIAGGTIAAGYELRRETVTATHLATHGAVVSVTSLRHDLTVQAGHVTVSRCAGSLCADAGLRLESDRARTIVDTAARRSSTRALPALGGRWTDHRGVTTIRVAYGRHLRRPSPDMLHPFAMGEDDLDGVIGNPALRAEVADHVELGVERHGELSWQMTPFVRWMVDPIRPLKSVTPNGGTVTMLHNLARSRSAGVDASARADVAHGVTMTIAGTATHTAMAAPFTGRGGLHGMLHVGLETRLAAGTSAQLFAGWRSAQPVEQGRIRSALVTELALTQRLAGSRGRATVRITDPLGTDRLTFAVADRGFAQDSWRRTSRPMLSLFASYAVGGEPRADAPRRPAGPASIF